MKIVEKINIHFMLNNFISKNCGIYEICGKIWYSQTGHR